jgi:2-polyprenyl-3-methyl-5-hydroxy-6-metoxy-1,4-benzoquinol methylase
MLRASLRRAYLMFVPEQVRARVRSTPWLADLRRRYFQADTRLHDEYYTPAYYQKRQTSTQRSAERIAADIFERFRPASFVDVGCGTGEYLDGLRKFGVHVHGIELADVAWQICKEKSLDVLKTDLTKTPRLPWRVDVVMSCEVAEHLPEEAAGTLVSAIASGAEKHVVFTAAAPGQEGLNHINLQPKSYWIEKFVASGFAYDEKATEEWQERNRQRDLPYWWGHNLMIFHRGE